MTIGTQPPTPTVSGCLTLAALRAGGGFCAVVDDTATGGSILLGVLADRVTAVRARLGQSTFPPARVAANYAIVHDRASATIAARATLALTRHGAASANP